ncbi:ABC transporter permease [Rhodoblastus acidophilus]|uniref:ABC transporter permease n=1 Tax=Candidatus Rhodoblastus alkanivorans TaxID=2954117 RepID=A0ABS9Z8S5_9HYPH|nr:ABC transporter permease [Candidatus Rhodoblastus alkanivorans]MCI4683996.1 ABC transporter permease [Candidatus Rhodoblastus alkanivorans]MDI4641315.1 ABC transporter permease [Rhodoblastus acidophilus]
MNADVSPTRPPSGPPTPRKGEESSRIARFFVSLERLYAVFVKELIQLRRDRLTFATMIAIPVMQLVLFGFAINSDPKHLPTAVLDNDHSAFSRLFITALKATDYFAMDYSLSSPEQIDPLILSGKINFAVEIPQNFARDLARGENPAILVIADAADPTAVNGASMALTGMAAQVFTRELQGPLQRLASKPAPYEVRLQKRYNPAGETRLNIVPGLVGTILTLTMLIFTALSVTREVERGTMESLLAMPINPVEIMLGKIMPYAAVGFFQMALIAGAARFIFNVPVVGNLGTFVVLTMLFIVANLSVGYTFSTIAKNQLQAMQMSFFFFLPSILLSGFMFPFRGMPDWAQDIGSILPLTHYLRIVRGVMLKGAGFSDLAVDTAALGAFTLAAMTVAVLRFRQTLD